MPMTPNTEQDWKAWRNLMWSKILLLICQADIRNPLRYLLITE